MQIGTKYWPLEVDPSFVWLESHNFWMCGISIRKKDMQLGIKIKYKSDSVRTKKKSQQISKKIF